MPRVAPKKGLARVGEATAPQQGTDRRHRWGALGMAYLIGSVVYSGVYLSEVHPSLANDYWWPDFNSTGLQTFLGDVYNSHLSQSRRGEFPLLGTDSIYSVKSYATPDTRIEWSASYGRQLLLDDLPLTVAINAVRVRNLDANFLMTAPYCWLDFNRSFAMAHSVKRQGRCEATKRVNAALYLESLTRNLPADAMLKSTQRQQINTTMFMTLQESVEGQWWIDALTHHRVLPVKDEVSYWTSRGLVMWKTTLQNLYHDGIMDAIDIRNALGYQQSMQIKKLSRFGRSVGRWTTLAAYDGIWNDLDIYHLFGASVFLFANNSFHSLGIDWDRDIFWPPDTIGTNLVRQFIGPFLSIDIEWVPHPPSLRAFHRAFRAQLATVYKDTSPLLQQRLALDPIPPTWHHADRVFYGGNPVCPFGDGKPFVQPSFGYYDDCSKEVPHSLDLSPEAVLFALQIMSPLSDKLANACSLCSGELSRACVNYLAQLPQMKPGQTVATSTTQELSLATQSLAIQFIQLASDNGIGFVLSQPMVPSDPSDPWTLFGWVMVYDWLQGDREAYNFEGDEGNVTLLSQPHPKKHSIVANPMELPSHACKYIWYITVYITFALSAVGLLTLVYAVVYRLRFDGMHLLQFNRVVGSVWIGRPMLFLRGMTAIVILSTVPVTFVKSGSMSVLQRSPRSFLLSCLLAGEGTWLTYVLQDIFTPVTRRGGWFIPASSCVVWAVYVILDQSSVLHVTSTIQPSCVVKHLGLELECTSGVVEIGSAARWTALWAVSAAVPVVFWGAALVSGKWKDSEPSPIGSGHQVLAPSAATSYLQVDGELDAVTSVLCGMLHFHADVFDIKLWRKLSLVHVVVVVAKKPVDDAGSVATYHRRWTLGFAGLGFLYMVSTVVASNSFLALTESTMSNDFWWATFNSTGHQMLLTSWFNNQLLLSNTLDATQIDQPKYGELLSEYKTEQSSFVAASLYAASIQNEALSDLVVAVEGLRAMDSCDLPWIASSYCFVDFGQRWEMAVSATRQDKCKLDVANGAVYLESILRNADWPAMDQCWGNGLARGVFDHVQQTTKGQEWVALVQSNTKLSVADEVATWLSYKVTAYTPQWQNYKKLGITETVLIQNAFGLAYPLTIRKSVPTTGTSASPSSFRMQWPLAKLLWAVASNTSGLVGHSLVRSSPSYAFVNTSTLERTFAQNGTLSLPLSQGLTLTRAVFGPFGTTSMARLAPPLELRTLYRDLTEAITALLAQNDTALQSILSIRATSMFTPNIAAWRDLNHAGGNFMCGIGNAFDPELAEFFLSDGSCSVNANEQTLDTKVTTMSALLTQYGRPPSFVQTTCLHESFARASCEDELDRGSAFFHSFMPPSRCIALAEQGNETKRIIQAQYAPQLAQYTVGFDDDAVPVLSHVGVFDEPTFEYFAWLYMFEWVLGYREVVRFDGELTSMTVVSGRPVNMYFEVNAQEIPQNVAFYIRSAIQYFTTVMLLVAVAVCMAIVTSRGNVEGLNMMEFNRVAGQVWIGRPLLFLRGITAVCILSTASLHLERPEKHFTLFMAMPPNAVTTMLSSGEMGWVVYILNDLFSVATQDVTCHYAWKSSSLAWIVAGVWSLVSPVQHVVTIDRKCAADTIDLAWTCQSGVFAIGSVHRFVGLLVLACVCCVVCFAVDRVFKFRPGKRAVHTSLLLHSVAQYQFVQTQWIREGVYNLDRASAILNGLLSFRTSRGALVLLDIKTWKVFVVAPQDVPNTPAPFVFTNAIPLTQ